MAVQESTPTTRPIATTKPPIMADEFQTEVLIVPKKAEKAPQPHP